MAASVSALAVAGLATSSSLARSPRPDLVVAKGSVFGSGGRLTGSLQVSNLGTAKSGPSTLTLTVRTRHGSSTAARFRIGRLGPSRSATVTVSVRAPAGLAPGSYPVTACADSSGVVRESSERNNCRRVGMLSLAAPGPSSTVPPDPVPFMTDTPLTLQTPQSNYWVDVPSTYDASNHTPMELLVWLHGCGGDAAGDVYTVSPPGARPYVSIAVGGREGDCWDPNTDQVKVLSAISDVETHFNVDRHKVVLGGYSSGGDLSYRLAFYHSLQFAGVLAENTSPFRDTGSSASQSLAAAQWKFHVVHLAHTEDAVYPLPGVEAEIQAMTDAGFPVQLIERPGTHYDDSTATTGTDHDLQTLLLPHLSDGWRSP
jgi:predicted esterase